MGLFGKKPTICTICKKETKHKHKAKKEWYVESPLCADCYMDKMKDEYDSNIKSKCLTCGTQKKITDFESTIQLIHKELEKARLCKEKDDGVRRGKDEEIQEKYTCETTQSWAQSET
mgnify:CR=1 FL=1